jgi:hypothetical protein
MSEQPDAGPGPSPPARSTGNVFVRKMGPMPLWAWLGVGLGVALAYSMWKKNKAAASASASTSTGSSGDTGGSTDSSLIPQFVNQTYVNSAPPTAPTPPTSTPTPPAAQVNQYPAVTGSKATKISNTSAKINWNYITGTTPKPTNYTIAAYTPNGKIAQQITVNAPDTSSGQGQATLSGLSANTKYEIRIWANGGKVAPTGTNVPLTL